jgi:hypothetical protein
MLPEGEMPNIKTLAYSEDLLAVAEGKTFSE